VTTLRGVVLVERGFDLVATVRGRECILLQSLLAGFLWTNNVDIGIVLLSQRREPGQQVLTYCCCQDTLAI
jgi:hypothetical protein